MVVWGSDARGLPGADAGTALILMGDGCGSMYEPTPCSDDSDVTRAAGGGPEERHAGRGRATEIYWLLTGAFEMGDPFVSQYSCAKAFSAVTKPRTDTF